MPSEQVLRAVLIKQMNGFSYTPRLRSSAYATSPSASASV
jgi:hypothetical protein